MYVRTIPEAIWYANCMRSVASNSPISSVCCRALSSSSSSALGAASAGADSAAFGSRWEYSFLASWMYVRCKIRFLSCSCGHEMKWWKVLYLWQLHLVRTYLANVLTRCFSPPQGKWRGLKLLFETLVLTEWSCQERESFFISCTK